MIKGVNDFQHTYPVIEDLWVYEQNERTPDSISDRCNDKFHLKCNKGHRYVAALNTLKSNDFKCLVCSNKIIQIGVNSLVDTDYLLSQEFSPNEERKPTEFTKTSAYSPLWKCTVCNNDYHWPIKDRELGDMSCPFCNNRYTKLGVNSLLDTDEELSIEYATDNEYDVTRINKDSKTWAYWICPDCHGRYGAYINEREVGDDSCPYCKNKKALEGVNSLVETHELLLKEWSINNIRKPSEFLKKSTYIALWNCPTCHNEYSERICNREVGDDSCPYCTNRKALPGFNSLIDTHELLTKEWSSSNERNASEFLKSNTYAALWNCPTCHNDYPARICDREVGDDSCPYCNNRRALLGFDSLVDTHELLTKEWPSSNELKPSEFLKSNTYAALWNCPTCHNDYPARICDREVRDDSCPYCNNGRALLGFNSLVDTHELLTKEWSSSNERKSSEFLNCNTYTALWNCPTCHNDYPTRICDREVVDDSCPYCNNRKALPGFNSFMVNHDDIMEEWDFINNYLLCNPDEILDIYSKDVWWNSNTVKQNFL